MRTMHVRADELKPGDVISLAGWALNKDMQAIQKVARIGEPADFKPLVIHLEGGERATCARGTFIPLLTEDKANLKGYHERVPFRLFAMPCCKTQICWVNPRTPTYCPECGRMVLTNLRFEKEHTLVDDKDAWLRTTCTVPVLP